MYNKRNNLCKKIQFKIRKSYSKITSVNSIEDLEKQETK